MHINDERDRAVVWSVAGGHGLSGPSPASTLGRSIACASVVVFETAPIPGLAYHGLTSLVLSETAAKHSPFRGS